MHPNQLRTPTPEANLISSTEEHTAVSRPLTCGDLRKLATRLTGVGLRKAAHILLIEADCLPPSPDEKMVIIACTGSNTDTLDYRECADLLLALEELGWTDPV